MSNGFLERLGCLMERPCNFFTFVWRELNYPFVRQPLLLLLNPPYRGGYVLVAGADLRLNDLTGAVATAALPPSDEPVAIRYPCASACAFTKKR